MFDFPASPSNGQTVTGASGAVYTFDGTKWRAGGTSSRASLTIGDTPPVSPMAGELWWDSVGGQLYVWFTDPNTSQWVLANSGPIASDAPNDARTYARRSQAWVDVSASVAAPANNVGRNLLHNPTMAVTQRGAGPWATGGAYTADRWVLQTVSDTPSVTIAAIADSGRAAIGDEAASSMLQNIFTGNAAAGAQSYIAQNIEGVRRLAGKTVTISFWAQASAALKLGINVSQVFGTGGSPSAGLWVLSTGNAVTLSTTWVRYSTTIALPSISGKTLGTNNNDYTGLAFFYSSGATNNATAGNVGVQSGTIQLWGVQLELGSVATPLDYGGSYADQLRACQRYYQIVACSARWPATAIQTIDVSVSFSSMRALPTSSLISLGTTGNLNSASTSFQPSNTVGGRFEIVSNGTGDCYALNASYALSADL